MRKYLTQQAKHTFQAFTLWKAIIRLLKDITENDDRAWTRCKEEWRKGKFVKVQLRYVPAAMVASLLSGHALVNWCRIRHARLGSSRNILARMMGLRRLFVIYERTAQGVALEGL